ncbi:MAG TPA: hypothetical protein VHC49_02135, partial [Mycobacteriales bacterium]|nr:hypothetical protein [Mycobacteriales bacterium]
MIVAAVGCAGVVAVATPGRAASGGGITTVAVTGSAISVSGTGADPGSVDIYALDPAQEPADYEQGVQVAEVNAQSGGDFSADFPRRDGSVDRYYR